MEIDIRKIKHSLREEKNSRKNNQLLEFLQKDIQLGRNKFTDSRKERFYSQLSILFSSGVDLGSALQIILEEKLHANQLKIFNQIYEEVIAGAGFSEAVKKTGHFSDYEYYSIKVGEESGRLHEVLSELHHFFELKVQQKRQLTGALSYPLMVTVVAIAAVLFMLNVVVPMFAGVFQRFGGELPAITKNVLNLSNWFSSHWLTVLVLLSIIIGLLLYARRFNQYRSISAKLILRLPFLGKFVRSMMHARFCHSVSLLTGTQVPLLDSLEMVKKMIRFHPYYHAIDAVQKEIEGGKSMHEGMKKQKVFDSRLTALTKVGEEVNKISTIYKKLYQQYTEEVKHLTSVLGNMLEPIMIVFVGVLVMVILIAMYLPLFQLSTSVI